jgi:gamma-glutamyltranspeptidase/glutathione hydrolase
MRSFLKLIFIAFILLLCSSFNANNENYLITASMSHKGVDAGMRILKDGGSAVDAALSVALSEIAETGGKYISYAGMMSMVYYEKKSGKIYNLSSSFNSIRNETDPSTIPVASYDTLENISNGRTILVPGFMKGVEAAHKKFGKVPFEKLFENAIKIAEDGTEWTDEDNYHFTRWKKILTKYPETKAVFTKPSGSYYRIGDTFKQPELAKTLKKISIEGADYMYKGEWAKKFVQSARNIGSKITLKDMQDYEVLWTNPEHGKYKDYDIYINGDASDGGIRLIEALNIAEEEKLSERGYYWESPAVLATIYQILSATLYSSNLPSYYGDSIDLTVNSRIKKETSKCLWKIWKAKNNLNNINFQKSKNEHTSGIIAVDREGNIVSLVHSICTINWGSNGLFVDGISIPDVASSHKNAIEKIEPGKRLPDGTIPGIVLKEEQPVMGFSCIGGGAVEQTFISLQNILDFNMNPQQSVEKPGFGEFLFVDNKLSLSVEQKAFSDSLLLKATELKGNFYNSPQTHSFFWTGIYLDNKTGELHGTKVWLR